MGAGLYGVIFCRQSESVETHGMEHIVSVHAQETAVNIRGGVALGMSYMQTCSGGIGEHVQNVATFVLGEGRIFRRMKSFSFFPALLPFLLDAFKGIFGHDINSSVFKAPKAMPPTVWMIIVSLLRLIQASSQNGQVATALAKLSLRYIVISWRHL